MSIGNRPPSVRGDGRRPGDLRPVTMTLGVLKWAEGSCVIRTGAAVFATNSPVNDKITIHTKQVPYRTYAIAGRVPKGGVPDALVWDTCDPYHYVRIQPLSDSEDLIIVGGEDHRSGEASDMDRRLAQLQDWTRERYLGFTTAQYRWSGEVLEPIDFKISHIINFKRGRLLISKYRTSLISNVGDY